MSTHTLKTAVQFINKKESLVVDALDGLLRASGGANLARLDGYPGIKVILRTDHKPNRVAIIAGGGSGHEPAHAGFVGKGMLTAAVCGDVFASPAIDAVFAAIMAVTGKGGCLVIFKNYTGDRLNFGLAVERARALGKKVEVVIVRDDIALPDIPQPRGIAGVMFVEKVAGHYAEKGADLKTVAAMAQKAADGLVSLGISLSSCTLPGIGREDRVPHGKAELGLGLHGEPGVDLVNFESARQAALVVADRLFAAAKPARRLRPAGQQSRLHHGAGNEPAHQRSAGQQTRRESETGTWPGDAGEFTRHAWLFTQSAATHARF